MSNWNQVKEKFGALSQREKVLITLVGWVAVIFISLSLFIEPKIEQYHQSQQKVVRSLAMVNQPLLTSSPFG